ncbi:MULTISPECIES: hypothetical protein [unclassified Leptotrichia]|uniref:hypothetical protein n=1 Tax=unclassified Leptotrichia TaxID=2633022 RepID=UPI0003AE0396|nr:MULTISPECIES: hypothetical protein [unclassified Leptotrichia]ERL26229.1 hypothetical protein HMPREF9108_01192 [Leptotrichia sp. oral taxon 225 str. F0581]WLD73241.1 hypothetical protein QU666_06285 [Leptotrichia sp. HMT-225]
MIKIDVDERKWEKIKEEHSEWYSDNILPNIRNAYEFIESQKSKSYSMKKYLELLKKIIDKGKDFIIQKELFLDYENKEIDKIIKIMKKKNKKSKSILEIRFEKLNISEEYLPNQLFCYKKLQTGNKNWNRHKLLSLIGIEICPYCQRNYISSYEENNDEKTTADLDHFYPKSLYPFLALSLYNFIPSCQICNSRFKGNKDTRDSVYLYEEGFDELGVKFRTSKEVISETLGERYSDFYVKIDYENLKNKEDGEKVKNSIENLGLDRVYKKSHNQYIQNLLYNIEKYPENYLENCVEMFESNVDKKKQLEEYFKDIVKEPYRKRIENGEPLAKLTKDILEEFNIKI